MHTASSERMKMKISWSASVFLLKPTKHVELNSCLLAVQSTLDTIILLFLVHFDFDDNSRDWKSLLDGTSAWTLHQGCTKTSSTRPCDDISRGGIMNTCLFPSYFACCLLLLLSFLLQTVSSFICLRFSTPLLIPRHLRLCFVLQTWNGPYFTVRWSVEWLAFGRILSSCRQKPNSKEKKM